MQMFSPMGLILPTTYKPNRLTADKDAYYHLHMARWCVYQSNNAKHREHMIRREVNKNFYSPNKQWYFEEDLQGFLMDTSGQNTTRIKTEYNLIQIMGNQYIGNANKMLINHKASSVSPLSSTRRELALAEMIYWTEIAKESPPSYAEYLKKKYPIGDDTVETKGLFQNIYVDEYVKSVNSLLRYGGMINRFDELKKMVAEDMVISGMAVMKPYIRASEYRIKKVAAERFFFDRSAKMYDLSDAGFMGEWDLALPSDIYEQYPDLDYDKKLAIENYVAGNTNTWAVDGRVVLYKVYWRDVIEEKYGYVKDESGNIYFARLNYDDYSDKPKYTEKDVVDCSELNKYQRSVVNKTKGKALRKVYCDQWRYCEFIPSELVGGYAMTYLNQMADVILDHGVVPFQESDINSPDNMLPPYKVNFYMYLDGQVFSPIDIAINPQRMVNRIYSVLENMMNNSTGAGTAYDPDYVEDETEFLTNMKQNKPVAIRTRGLGINNIMTRYDNTPSQGMGALTNIASVFAAQIEQITGVNSAMKGQVESADQLVGVMQLMIKRGSVTQERFYAAFESIFKACYQAIASVGKRFYIANKKELIDSIGDEGASVLTLSEDLNNEDFRVDTIRSLSPEDERRDTDTKILQFVQMGFLDKTRAANLLGRAYEEDLWSAIREAVREQNILQAAMEKQQAQQTEQMQQMAALSQQQEQQNAQQQQDIQLGENQKDREAKLKETAINAMVKVHDINSKNEMPTE